MISKSQVFFHSILTSYYHKEKKKNLRETLETKFKKLSTKLVICFQYE